MIIKPDLACRVQAALAIAALAFAASAAPAKAQVLANESLTKTAANGNPCWVLNNHKDADAATRTDVGQIRIESFRVTCYSPDGVMVLQEPDLDAICHEGPNGEIRFSGVWYKSSSKSTLIMNLPPAFGCVYEFDK